MSGRLTQSAPGVVPWEGPGPRGMREAILLRSGGSDAHTLQATGIPRLAGLWLCRETPGGAEYPGAASRGPCCGWEQGAGATGSCTASPGPGPCWRECLEPLLWFKLCRHSYP